MMPLSRRDALRLALPFALSPSTLLAAPEDGEVPLLTLDTAAGWSSGAKVVSEAPGGGRAIAWTAPADGTVVTLSRTLDTPLRDQVARSAILRFRYRVDGPTPETLHVKIIAAPLAGGYQALFSLTIPPPGEWRETTLRVQEYSDVWGTDVTPQANGGSLQWRVGKKAGESPRLMVADLRVTPLPAGAAINRELSRETRAAGVKVKPLVTPETVMRLPDHPRLLLTAAELPAVKRRASDTEWGRAFVAGLRTRADETLAKPVALPDRGGQWFHYYACPKHGTRLRTEAPTRHVCPTGGEVFTGYPYDDVFLSTVHNRFSDAVRDLGLLYRLTGEKKYAARAREILLAYADKYLTYPLHDIKGEAKVGGGRVGPQTLDESTWLIPMAQGCDAVWDMLSAADRDTLRTKLFYPAATDVIQKHRMSIHNIQCWKNSAVGLVGLLFGDAALVSDAIDNPERGMQAQLARGITDDGPWYEGAWGYHFYTISALAPLAEAAHRCGIDLYKGPQGDRYKRFYLAPIQMAMPDGRLPAFNDSGTATANGNALYELALARWGDPALAAPLRASNRRTLHALLSGVDTLPAASAKPEPSRNFADVGYAILRGGTGESAAYLALKYGPHGGGHGHPDKLNFVLYGGGRVIADDPGTAAYGVPIQAGWYKTTLAHNTLVVDEENQKPATGKAMAFEVGEGWSAFLADAGPIYDGITFRRATFLLGADAAVFLDLVRVTDTGRPRTIDLTVHPNGVWESVGGLGAGSKPDQLPANKPGYSYLREVAAYTAAGGSEGVGDQFTATTRDPQDGRLRVATLTFSMLTEGAQGTTFFAGTGVGRNTEDRVPLLLARRRIVAGMTCFAWAVGWGKQTPAGVTLRPLTPTALAPAGVAAVRADLGNGRSFVLIANPENQAVTLHLGADPAQEEKATPRLRIKQFDYRGAATLHVSPLPFWE
jgi:hypothetical protein